MFTYQKGDLQVIHLTVSWRHQETGDTINEGFYFPTIVRQFRVKAKIRTKIVLDNIESFLTSCLASKKEISLIRHYYRRLI